MAVQSVQLYDPATSDLMQRQARAEQLAQLLQAQAFEPMGPSPNAPYSWTQGAAKLAQAWLSRKKQKEADKAGNQISTAQQATFDRMFPGAQPQPNISPDQALEASLAAPGSQQAQQLGEALAGPKRPPGAPSLTGNPDQDRMMAQMLGPQGYMQAMAQKQLQHDQEGFGQPEAVIGPDGKPVLAQFGNRGTVRPVAGYQPNPLEQYGRVNPGDYTPESLAKYAQTRDFKDLVRIWAPEITKVGNVPSAIERTVGGAGGSQSNVRPLGSIEGEAAGAATVAGAEAGAKAAATAAAEQRAGQMKKGTDAENTGALLTMAEPLIDIATGSVGGAAADTVAGWFGFAPDGAQAIASLKVLQAGLMLNQPRMEGPQSDADTKLYREAAGQIGDPTVPAATKKAAVRTILEIQARYKKRAQAAAAQPTPGMPAARPAPAPAPGGVQYKFNPKTGQLEAQ